MKTQPTTRNLASSGIKNTVSFGIKEDGFAHIFNVLRNQLYSDKYKAVLREYSTNGVDAHVEAGIPERPIEVTLPTLLSPLLKIRDFGSALTEQEVHEIYAFYGESTKRNTNSQTGMLGIGSKSAFAYGDNFVITSFVDGLKHTYNAFIDPSQVGQIAKLGEEESDEENGVEISIPVKEDDIETFRETASEIFKYFKVRPVIKGQKVEFDKDREMVFEGDDWTWFKNSQDYSSYYSRNGTGEAVAVMGNIGYPIDFDSLNYKGEDVGELERIAKDNLRLEIPIGELEISASREQLQYTDHTIKSIITKLKSVRKEIINKIKKDFAGCETLYEAKCLVGTMDDMTSGLYQFRELINKNIKVKGKLVDSDNFSPSTMEEGEVTLKNFTKTQRSQKLKLEGAYAIHCKKETLVVENDERASRGLMNKLLALELEQGRKVYLITYKDDKAKKKFAKETGFDCPSIQKFSELPSRKLNEFEGYGRTPSVDGSWQKDKNSKHSSNVFELKWDDVGGWNNKASDRWSKKLVDFDNESGVYMIIDRFQPDWSGKDHSYRLNDLGHWGKIKKFLESFDIDLPQVIGVKKSHARKVEGKDGWVDVLDWIRQEIAPHVENIKQDLVDWKESQKVFGNYRFVINEGGECWDKGMKPLLSKLTKDSDFKVFYDCKMKMDRQVKANKSADSIGKINDVLVEDMKVELDLDGIAPTFDLDGMAKKMDSKYTMLKHLDTYNFFGYRVESEKVEDLANYINVIDVCNANKNS